MYFLFVTFFFLTCTAYTWTQGLVGYWNFNEPTGDYIYDSTVNYNTGTIKQGITRIARLENDGCLDLEKGYIEIPPYASLNLNKECTISCWIYPYNTKEEQKLISKTAGKKDGFVFSFGKPNFVVRADVWDAEGRAYNSYSTQGSTIVTIVPETWQHVAFTYSNNRENKPLTETWKLETYLNGKKVDTQSILQSQIFSWKSETTNTNETKVTVNPSSPVVNVIPSTNTVTVVYSSSTVNIAASSMTVTVIPNPILITLYPSTMSVTVILSTTTVNIDPSSMTVTLDTNPPLITVDDSSATVIVSPSTSTVSVVTSTSTSFNVISISPPKTAKTTNTKTVVTIEINPTIISVTNSSVSVSVLISTLTLNVEISTTTVDIYLSSTSLTTYNIGTTTGVAIVIGSDPVNKNQTYSGMLDEVRVYNVSLTTTEIKNLYESSPISWGPGNLPPNRINNLRATLISPGTVKLNWSAPGDDAVYGQAKEYIIRYSTMPEVGLDTNVWKENRPTSGPYGTIEEEIVTGLNPDFFVYFFWIKSVDKKGSVSKNSNRAETVKEKRTVLLMHFNEPTDSKDAPPPQDFSGMNHHASFRTAISYTTSTWRTVTTGLEKSFKYEKKYLVQIPPYYSLKAYPYGITIKAWVQKASEGEGAGWWEGTVIGSADGKGLRIRTLNRKLVFNLTWENGTTVSVTGNKIIPFNEWFFVTVTYDGNYMQIYYNGVLDKQLEVKEYIYENINTNLTIGGVPDPNGEWFVGLIDELEIRNYPMPATEIWAEYAVATGRVPPATITDLTVKSTSLTTLLDGRTAATVQLTWTAPGDDGTTGTAAGYYVKYSYIPVSDDTWDMGFNYPQSWKAQPFGNTETGEILNLKTGTKYYFGIRTFDTRGNVSGTSNSVRLITQGDLSPPVIPAADKIKIEWGTIEGLNNSVEPYTQMQVYVINPDKYNQAKPVFQTTASKDGTFTINVGTEYTELWLTSSDESGNKSPALKLTNNFIPTENNLLPAQPNPYKPVEHNQGVIIPYSLKEDTNVTIKIFNSTGELVKILVDNEPKKPGLYRSGVNEEFQAAIWDGINTEGLQVASGVYIYTLEAGKTRLINKLFLIR